MTKFVAFRCGEKLNDTMILHGILQTHKVVIPWKNDLDLNT